MGAAQSQDPEAADAVGRALLHEVGNLLAASRLNAHFLSDALPDEDRQRMAREVQLLSTQAGALLQLLRRLRFGAPPDRRATGSPVQVLRGVGDALSGCHVEDRLLIAAGRGLPDVRVEPDVLHTCLVALVGDALAATAPAGRVRVRAAIAEKRVILTVLDAGEPVRLPRRAPPPTRGRALTAGVVAEVLRAAGARLVPGSRPRSNQQDLVLRIRAPGSRG